MVIDVKYKGETNENFTKGKIYFQALLISDDTLVVLSDNRKSIHIKESAEWKGSFENLGINGSAKRKEDKLYNKYLVINNRTGEVIDDRCFVLKPDQDPVARIAIKAYADATDNQELAENLRRLADYEFAPCGCREAMCGHMFGGYERLRKDQ